MTFIRPLCLVALLALVAGCPSKQETGGPADTATSGTMEFVADAELKPALDSLVTGFNAENPSAKVTVRYLPATEALDAMLQKRSRLVIIGRPLNAKERGILAGQNVQLVDFDIALNSIACIVSAASDTKSITLTEIRDLVLGTNTSLTQVLSLHLSSTEAILDSLFHEDTASVKGKVLRFSTADSVVAAVRRDKNAIGYISTASVAKYKSDSTVRILDISVPDASAPGGVKPVMLHPAYVYQGKYPLVSRIMGYTMETPNTLPRGFLAYAMSAHGQRVFLNYDLVPRTQIIRLVPPKQ